MINDYDGPIAIAVEYVNRIRNIRKAGYASEYLEWRIGTSVECPDRGDLSVMAAQSVRMRIDSILNGGE